ncbi:MAG: adenylate cyclase class 2 [Saprospiraceae bacterium]|jgi:adenylate cyclase class 2
MPTLIEIKARCEDPTEIRRILEEKNAKFEGVDHQVDTYFKVDHGRLKLREGNIENHLIHYFRGNQAGPKKSEVLLYKSTPDSSLKSVLVTSIGVLTIVDKKREIRFIDNVKFHIDIVKDLGNFIEIEAIDIDGSIPEEKLLEQCQFYIKLFGVKDVDLLENSYSDMLLA